MVFEMFFVRRAYTQILAGELKKIVRMLQAVPAQRFDAREPDCGASPRELAMGLVARVRRIHEIAYGPGAHTVRTHVPSRGEILLALESAFLGAHSALATLPATRWQEVIPAPIGLPTLRQARRGELLWLSLRELIRHGRHFGLHVRSLSHGGAAETLVGSKPVPAATPEAPLAELAFGA